ncbi:MAG: SMI1/KNR4 family protein [bacterium]
MPLTNLLDEYIDALRDAGVQTPFAEWSQFDAATDDELEELENEIGTPLSSELGAWLRHLTCAIPLKGGYEAVPISSILDRTQSTQTIDFSKHLANIFSWNDGRFDDNRMAKSYWQPAWVGFARDGGGNEYCVDLAPGPAGEHGQILMMEFQDGQGPYVSEWPTLEAMMREHLALMNAGDFSVDDEGFIEFD